MRNFRDSNLDTLSASKILTVPRLKISETPIQPQGSLVYNTEDDLLYYSNRLSWIPLGTSDEQFIDQAQITAAGGTLTLTTSGSYCVRENVTGSLIIGTDNICLDLCCHILDAGATAFGISATGVRNISIFNGSVVNSTSSGVLITGCTAVTIFDLFMRDNAIDAISATGTVDLSVAGINSVGTVTGERMLHFDTCNNVTVANCNATGYLSTIGAVVELDTCNAVSVQDVDVTGNTKANLVSTAATDLQAMLVAVNSCHGVDFVHVKVNDNTSNNTNAGTRSFSAIGFVSSNSCSMHRCETSNNIDVAGGASAFDRIVLSRFTNNLIITEHQANNNRCDVPIENYTVIEIGEAENVIFDTCQVNNNFVQELIVVSTATAFAEFAGINFQWVSDFVTPQPQNAIIRNCQTNYNSCANGGTGRDPLLGNLGIIEPIKITGGDVVIDNCQANYNTMGGSNPLTFSTGITVLLAPNVTIWNSTANNNSGGEFSMGMNIAPVFGLGSNPTVINCSANTNDGYGIFLGSLITQFSGPRTNIAITDSVFNDNGHATHDAAGIRIRSLTHETTSNVLIKGCQIYNTFSGAGLAVGINVAEASNVVIEDTNVFNTASSTTGHGILLDTCTNSKILRTQVHGNASDGIQLTASSSGCLIQDIYAVGNTGTGINDLSPFANACLGNKAQSNGTAYSGVAAGNISTYTKATGLYAGGSAPNIYTTTNLSIL